LRRALASRAAEVLGLRNSGHERELRGAADFVFDIERRREGAERRRCVQICDCELDGHEQLHAATFGAKQHSDEVVDDDRCDANTNSELKPKLNFELEAFWDGLRREFVRNADDDNYTVRRQQCESLVGELHGANDGP